MSNDDQLGLLLLNLNGDIVDTNRQEIWLLVWLIGATGSLGLSTSSQTGLLLGLGLWLVLHGKLEEGGSGLLVQALAELVDHWWDLETLLENGALTLDADILGPLDEAGQVTLWLDITTDSERFWGLLEEWVGFLGLLSLLDE